MKIIKISILIIIVLLLLYLNKPKTVGALDIVTIGIEEKTEISALLAATPVQRWQGLKGVEKMPRKYQGMLFLYPNETKRYFTMEGTLMNLDIVFIDENRVITIIFDNVENYPEFVIGKKPVIVSALAKYVLEIPAGKAKEYGMKQGVKLNFGAEVDEMEKLYFATTPSGVGILKPSQKIIPFIPQENGDEEPPLSSVNGEEPLVSLNGETKPITDPISEVYTTPKAKPAKAQKGAIKTQPPKAKPTTKPPKPKPAPPQKPQKKPKKIKPIAGI